MTRLTPILLGLTFVMSVVTMALVLWLVVTEPWEPDAQAATPDVQSANEEPLSRCERLWGIFAQSGEFGQRYIIHELDVHGCRDDWGDAK